MDTSNVQLVSLAVVTASTVIASAIDLKHRRIPNTLSLATAVTGVALAAAGLTGITLWSSLVGLGLGLVLMLPGHLFGATGAGDVKLFAAAGTVLGASQTFQAFLFVAIAGGVLAVAVAARRGRLTHTVTTTAALCGRSSSARPEIESPAADNRFAYGPAIAIGCIAAALV